MAQGFGTTATYQFHRTERWLGRVKAIYCGEYTPVGNFDNQLDQVLAFSLTATTSRIGSRTDQGGRMAQIIM